MRKLLCLQVLIGLIAVVGASRTANAQNQPSRLSDHDLKGLMERTQHDADRFRHSLHEELEHAHWEDKRDRESMNSAASEFERATDRLRDHFHNGNARPEDIQEVLTRGATIDSFIVGRGLMPRAKSDWVALRGDLDQLAGAYNINWQWPAGPPPER